MSRTRNNAVRNIAICLKAWYVFVLSHIWLYSSNLGSCVAFANMAAIETCFKKKTGVFGEFSKALKWKAIQKLKQVTILSSSWWIAATRRTVRAASTEPSLSPWFLICFFYFCFTFIWHFFTFTFLLILFTFLSRCKRLQRSLLLLLHQDHCWWAAWSYSWGEFCKKKKKIFWFTNTSTPLISQMTPLQLSGQQWLYVVEMMSKIIWTLFPFPEHGSMITMITGKADVWDNLSLKATYDYDDCWYRWCRR